MRHSGGAQRTFPVSSNSQDGAVGEAGLHSHLAEATFHEATTVQIRHDEVR